MNKGKVFREMLDELPLRGAELIHLISNAPYTYKVYEIPKRTGGTRTIAQPAKATKFLQYWAIENYLSKLPIHLCATAYREGLGIKENATRHKNNAYLAKFDFKDFFVSIKGDDFKSHLKNYFGAKLSDDDLILLERICFIKRIKSEPFSLSIGSPSSPVISNSIMYQFDCLIAEWCSLNEVVYTRYADDLTFSTNIKDKTAEVEAIVRQSLNQISYPSLRLNRKKTTLVSKKYQRRITGLIITNEKQVSLGRYKKRYISSLVHKFKLGLLDKDSVSSLQGNLAYAMDVEPLFVERLARKYGDETIDKLRRMVEIKDNFPFG